MPMPNLCCPEIPQRTRRRGPIGNPQSPPELARQGGRVSPPPPPATPLPWLLPSEMLPHPSRRCFHIRRRYAQGLDLRRLIGHHLT
jgi:hypothetical protein